jgi:hypothetical protein
MNSYKFCSDEFADGFRLTCTRWDLGRFPAEISQLYEKRAEADYWFTNYSRGNPNAPNGLNFNLINTAFQRQYLYAYRAGLFYSWIKAIYGYSNRELLEQYKSASWFQARTLEDQAEIADYTGVTAATMLNTIQTLALEVRRKIESKSDSLKIILTEEIKQKKQKYY